MGASIPNIGSSAVGDPIGKAVVQIIGDDKAYQNALKKSEKSLGLFDKKTQKIARKAGKAFLIGGTAIAGALSGVIFHAARAGDELDKMSLRTGVSVENLSRLSFAAERSGSDITAMETSLRFLSRRMDEASKGVGIAKDAFDDLGITLTDQMGQLRSQPDVIKDVATAISNLDSETRQVAVAMDIFGARSGPGLLPLLKQGETGIQELMDRADELGIVMSTEAAAASAQFSDQMLDLTKSLKMAGFELGQVLLPAAENAVEFLTESIAKFNKLSDAKKKMIGYGGAVGAFLGIFTGAGLLVVSRLDALRKGFKLLAPAISGVGFATAAASAAALGSSLWALHRIVKAFDKPGQRLREEINGLSLAQKRAYDTATLIREALNRLAREGIDPSTVAIGELGISVDELNEAYNQIPAAAKNLRNVIDQDQTSIVSIIQPTANAADTLEALVQGLIKGAEKGSVLKQRLESLGEAEEDTTETTKTLSKELQDLKDSLTMEAGDTWFLRVFKETQELTRTPPVVDINPGTRSGVAGYITGLFKAARAHEKLGKQIQQTRKEIGLEEYDQGIIARGAAFKAQLTEEQAQNEQDLAKELNRLRAAGEQEELERLGRINAQADKDHQDKIDAAIELAEIEEGITKKSEKGLQKIRDDSAKKKAAEDKKQTEAALEAEKKALERSLAMWESFTSDVRSDVGDMFEDMMDPSAMNRWENFWKNLAASARRYISDLLTSRLFDDFVDVTQGKFQFAGNAGRAFGNMPAPGAFTGAGRSDHPAPIGPTPTGKPLAPPGADPIAAVLAGLDFAGKAHKVIFGDKGAIDTGDANLDQVITKAIRDLRFAFPEENALQSQLLFQGRAQQLIDTIVQDYDDQLSNLPPGSRYIPPDKFGIFGLAEGGIVRKPTFALLGERYKEEAVIPLKNGALPVSGPIGGDINIDQLIVNFPSDMRDMTRPEVDELLTKQLLPSIGRAARRDPRSRAPIR
jgi:TP901 family phage tail tape measure protein